MSTVNTPAPWTATRHRADGGVRLPDWVWGRAARLRLPSIPAVEVALMLPRTASVLTELAAGAALLPPVIGVGVGLGIAAALAVFPGGTPTIAGVAGVAVGLLTVAALRVLPRKPRIAESSAATDDEKWVDDGSGEREVWSGHNTRDDLSAFSAWAHGDRELDQDATGVMPAATWDAPEPAVADGAGEIRPYQPRHRAKVVAQ